MSAAKDWGRCHWGALFTTEQIIINLKNKLYTVQETTIPFRKILLHIRSQHKIILFDYQTAGK